MLGRTTQTIFTHVFVMMILNWYFLIFSVAGLIILGVGPALRAVSELFLDGQWEWQQYSFTRGWQYFRRYFWTANRDFWVFGGLFAILAYNLYLSTQINHSWVLWIQFAILIALFLDIVIGLLFLVIQSRYTVSFKHSLVLALAQFFDNPLHLLRFVFGVATIVIVTRLWPGLALFVTVGAIVVWTNWTFRQWYAKIDVMLP